MARTVLLTGFGPFPGAPFNPTGPLVKRLARIRHPSLADAKLIAHVFPTSYAAVDRDLPVLIERHKPDVLLMFGLHGRAKTLRLETRGRNALALIPDASGKILPRRNIVEDGPPELALPAPVRQMLARARTAGAPTVLSRDAGRYLCNYLCWRAAEAAARKNGPRVAAFVHVPVVSRKVRPRRRAVRRQITLDDLVRVGRALLTATASSRFGQKPKPE